MPLVPPVLTSDRKRGHGHQVTEERAGFYQKSEWHGDKNLFVEGEVSEGSQIGKKEKKIKFL